MINQQQFLVPFILDLGHGLGSDLHFDLRLTSSLLNSLLLLHGFIDDVEKLFPIVRCSAFSKSDINDFLSHVRTVLSKSCTFAVRYGIHHLF